MNTIIVVNGHTFETAQLVDVYNRKTHDITVIFKHNEDDSSIDFINYYFGDATLAATAKYIEAWLDDQSTKPAGVTLDGDSKVRHSALKDFRKWFDEVRYEPIDVDHVTLTVGSKHVNIPFHADTYEQIERFLQAVDENW